MNLTVNTNYYSSYISITLNTQLELNPPYLNLLVKEDQDRIFMDNFSICSSDSREKYPRVSYSIQINVSEHFPYCALMIKVHRQYSPARKFILVDFQVLVLSFYYLSFWHTTKQICVYQSLWNSFKAVNFALKLSKLSFSSHTPVTPRCQVCIDSDRRLAASPWKFFDGYKASFVFVKGNIYIKLVLFVTSMIKYVLRL